MQKYPTYLVSLARPESDEETETYEVYVDLMLDEADALMQWTGLAWGKWLAAAQRNDPDALRFLYWLARKRAGKPIEGKFSEINFWLHALTVDLVDRGDFGDDEPETIELTDADPTEGVETESA